MLAQLPLEPRLGDARLQAGLFAPLGDGDVPIAEVVTTLADNGYGGRYVLERESTIATVPLGYDDGYPRQAQGAEVLIGGIRRPVRPSRPWTSLPQMPQARTSMSTSSGPIEGSGTSPNVSRSGSVSDRAFKADPCG